MLMHNAWEISPYYEGKYLKLFLELIHEGETICRFKVIGRNRFVVIETDLPFLLSSGSKKKPNWKIREGIMYDAALFNAIIEEIRYVVKNDGKKPRKPEDHPKNR